MVKRNILIRQLTHIYQTLRNDFFGIVIWLLLFLRKSLKAIVWKMAAFKLFTLLALATMFLVAGGATQWKNSGILRNILVI